MRYSSNIVRSTGTFGRDRQTQWQITKSSINGNTLTIEAEPGSNFRFIIKLDRERLTGEAFKDGVRIGTVQFERVKR